MTLLSIRLTVDGTAAALLLSALFWLPFARGGRPTRVGLLWLAAPLAGLLFLVGVFEVQVQTQAVLGQALAQAISPLTLEALPLLIAVPLALLAGVLQEAARLAGIVGALGLARQGRAAAPWAGALAGAGVGVVEAAWLLGAVPPGHFGLLGAAVLERAAAIAFHVGAGALIGFGIAARRTAAAFALSVLVHTAIDTGAALYQMGRTSAAITVLVAATLGASLFLWMLLLAVRRGRSARALSA